MYAGAGARAGDGALRERGAFHVPDVEAERRAARWLTQPADQDRAEARRDRQEQEGRPPADDLRQSAGDRGGEQRCGGAGEQIGGERRTERCGRVVVGDQAGVRRSVDQQAKTLRNGKDGERPVPGHEAEADRDDRHARRADLREAHAVQPVREVARQRRQQRRQDGGEADRGNRRGVADVEAVADVRGEQPDRLEPEPLQPGDGEQDHQRRHAGVADLAREPLQIRARRPRGARRERGRHHGVGDGLAHRLAPVAAAPT